jgi:hypothetical protein
LQYRKLFFFLLFTVLCIDAPCQSRFSLASDVSLLRSFKNEQQYWAIGQTVVAHFHFTPTEGAYVFFTYYGDGKFNNELVADARSPAITPAQQTYNNEARLSFRHFSLGWKHYFKNTYDAEKNWGIYGFAGFGLMIGRINNTHNLVLDTADYKLPVLAGNANFKRLTLDLGLGYEAPLGGDFYFYLEGRSLVPITDYPSNYLYNNKYSPLTASVELGLRILF